MKIPGECESDFEQFLPQVFEFSTLLFSPEQTQGRTSGRPGNISPVHWASSSQSVSLLCIISGISDYSVSKSRTSEPRFASNMVKYASLARIAEYNTSAAANAKSRRLLWDEK